MQVLMYNGTIGRVQEPGTLLIVIASVIVAGLAGLVIYRRVKASVQRRKEKDARNGDNGL